MVQAKGASIGALLALFGGSRGTLEGILGVLLSSEPSTRHGRHGRRADSKPPFFPATTPGSHSLLPLASFPAKAQYGKYLGLKGAASLQCQGDRPLEANVLRRSRLYLISKGELSQRVQVSM